jgi:hypothetical protein
MKHLPDQDALSTQGSKLYNLMRSAKFSKETSSAYLALIVQEYPVARIMCKNPTITAGTFSLLRAAAVNLMAVKDESTSVMIVALLRTYSKSSAELGRNPNLANVALQMVTEIDRRWASIDAHIIARLLPNELNECEHIVLDSLLLRADLLASSGHSSEAVEVLMSGPMSRLSKSMNKREIFLGTKVE